MLTKLLVGIFFTMYYFLFFICVISRILSSIFYIEDIDSLRFALSVIDSYDLTKLQPHFPGYPIFCFIAIILYSITNSIALSFSIIGGISTYVIIYYSVKILKYRLDSIQSLFLVAFLFLNPMIWLLGNRYMPDLLGLAIAVAVIYYLLFSQIKIHNYFGLFLSGFLLGVRLSYFPLLIIPIIFFVYKNKNFLILLFYFSIGILVWLIPFIFTQGFENLITIGFKHTSGHFNDYGGTIITEANLWVRLKFLIHTIWSDGLGGYWHGRSWMSVITGVSFLFLLKEAFIENKKSWDPPMKILFFSVILYLVWIFLFQNLIYKSRHVLPLVFILILFIFNHLKFRRRNRFPIIYILFLGLLNFNLLQSHADGTAVFNLTENLKNSRVDFIISNPLINYYLKSNGLSANYINIEKLNQFNLEDEIIPESNVKIIGNYIELFNKEIYEISQDSIYYHNPYMNRMWSEIQLFSLKVKND